MTFILYHLTTECSVNLGFIKVKGNTNSNHLQHIDIQLISSNTNALNACDELMGSGRVSVHVYI
jgi:hypothetical protein